MSKFLYPIYKLKTKSYIKWWLYHKKAGGSGVLSEILEGFSFNLENTLNRKFKLFEIEGNSVQDGSPSPDNEVPIKSAGDNGFINEKISNIKDLLDWNKFIDFSNWAKAASPSYMCFKIDGLKANTKYTLCRVDDSGYNTSMYAGFNTIRNNSNLFINSSDATFNKKSVTTTTDDSGKVYLVFYMSSAAQLQNYINLIQDCWVIEGKSFVEKEEQNISFPLAKGQKLMEGDYLADDGIHHKSYQYEMNGVDNALRVLAVNQYNGIYYCACTPAKRPKTAAVGFCSHFKFVGFGIEPGKCYTTGTNVIFVLKDQTITTVAQANAWLAEQKANGTPVTFQIVVLEEYIDPYTEEQKEAWEQIKKARTYKGGTIISSEDETPAYLKIQYYKEG